MQPKTSFQWHSSTKWRLSHEAHLAWLRGPFVEMEPEAAEE